MYFKLVLSSFLFFGFAGTCVADRPNILLIMLDDLNDYTGYLGGHPQVITPHMDALASQSVRFDNAHCNAQICAPSRASMLTGIYPHVSGNYWFTPWKKNRTLRNCKTLPHFMKDNGYLSYGTGKLMHHEAFEDFTEFGERQDPGPYPSNGKKKVAHPSVPAPFQEAGHNDGTYASLADVPHVPPSGDLPGYKGWTTRKGEPFRYVNADDRDLMSDELQAEWAVERLQQLADRNETQPFFLAVGFSRPHTPLVAPQAYFDLYPLDSLELPPIKANDQEDCHLISIFQKWDPAWYGHHRLLEESYPTLEEGLKLHLQAYLACITFVDVQIGKVVDALDQSPFKENTIVILVSDHGYHQGEKQYLYKNSLWEESTRIPMLIRGDQFAANAGKIVRHPVSLIDVYPTIVDLCGLSDADNRITEKGAPLSGHSLKAFLENPESANWSGPDVALSVVNTPKPQKEGDADTPAEHSYAVRSDQFRYIHYVSGKEELYDHTHDSMEWRNLAHDPEYATVKAKLKSQMEALTGDLDETSFVPVR